MSTTVPRILVTMEEPASTWKTDTSVRAFAGLRAKPAGSGSMNVPRPHVRTEPRVLI